MNLVYCAIKKVSDRYRAIDEWLNSGVGEKEVHERVLRPVAVVATVGRGEKSAVTSMGGFNQRDVGVRLELTSAFVGNAYEGIVQCMQDERWHSYGINNARGCRSVVVVVRSREAGVH